MDEEIKGFDDDQNYDQELEEEFEIGIPIEEAQNPPKTDDPKEGDTNTVQSELDDRDDETDSVDDLEAEPDPGSELGIDPSADDDIPVFPPDAFEDTVESEDNDSNPPEVSPLEEIKLQLQMLSQAFEDKLKYDQHKDKVINDLHNELQEYRGGLLKKYLHRVITDIIKIVDDMRKFISHYNHNDERDETTEKLLKYIEDTASDLEDVFSWEGVTPFTCEGNNFDPTRQRIVNKITTDDPEQNKTIAERLRPGYEWDGKIIRHEMVSAYVLDDIVNEEENNS